MHNIFKNLICTVGLVSTTTVYALEPTPNYMPTVDLTKSMTPAVGFNVLRVKPTTELPLATGGAFRIVCTPSHMSNDDPIVYPNQPGAAHHHTFFGNTSTNYASDVNNMAIIGNSTCNGGLMNRSSYWMPSMIDTATNAAVLPTVAIFYYKKPHLTPFGVDIVTPPKGLRMIAGNMKAKTELESSALFTCLSRTPFYGWKRGIPTCNVGETMQEMIKFPSCWDGINLDAPDHKSHMSYQSVSNTSANKCPATHPVAIPEISLNLNYKVLQGVDMSKWRLASDNYVGTSGYSAHADWVNGWNAIFMDGIVKNCLNKNMDCHAHLLGDMRMFY